MRKHPHPFCASAPRCPSSHRPLTPPFGAALAKALENGGRALMRSPVSDNFEFPVQANIIPRLRACARRNAIAIEPVGQ
jgi:hypothetical protein